MLLLLPLKKVTMSNIEANWMPDWVNLLLEKGWGFFCSLTIDFNPTLKAHVAIWAVNCRFPFGKERFTALVESSQHKSPLLTVASEIKSVKWLSMNLDFGQKYLNKSAEHSYTEQDLITDKVFKYYSSVAAM